MRSYARAVGWSRACLAKLPSVPWLILLGSHEIAVSPLLLVAGVRRFKKSVIDGGKKVTKGAGRLAAMLNVLPRPYRTIVGD